MQQTQRVRQEAVMRRVGQVNNGTSVIALDGRAAAGKSTLAAALAETLQAAVIHMDDFFLPPALRTPQRLDRPGGNIHYERFAEEVLPRLRGGQAFCYRRFDCRTMDYGGWAEVPAAPILLVEGAYAHHPFFGRYADLTVFCDISPARQKQRILARNGREGWPAFRDRWIPLEEAYLAAFRIRERADLVI